MMPVFPIKLILLIVLVIIAAAIMGVGSARGGLLKKQGVAWAITALMIVVAVCIGRAKAPVNNAPAPEPGYAVPATVPPDNMTPVYAVGSYVRDDAGVLSSRTEDTLNSRNERLLERYNVLVGVATCNYGRDDLGSFARKYFEDMGLGGYDMLVVLDISGDNYWLYTGDDVAWDFSDQDCADYTYDYMEDYFARGMYDDAVLDLTEALEVWYGNYYG